MGLFVQTTDPSPLVHSWPLFESDQRLDLGCHYAWRGDVAIDPLADTEPSAPLSSGVWDCDLADSRLTWSAGVYDLFGLPRGEVVPRSVSLSLYAESSRVAMERLRAYAIRHRRGFTLDIEILPADGGRRWIRLDAAPLCVDSRPVRLRGFKRDVSHHYR